MHVQTHRSAVEAVEVSVAFWAAVGAALLSPSSAVVPSALAGLGAGLAGATIAVLLFEHRAPWASLTLARTHGGPALLLGAVAGCIVAFTASAMATNSLSRWLPVAAGVYVALMAEILASAALARKPKAR
jgi:hypothetical protein